MAQDRGRVGSIWVLGRSLFGSDSPFCAWSCGQNEPGGQGGQLVFSTPRSFGVCSQRRHALAKFPFRPFEESHRRRVKVSLTPDRTTQMAASRGILDDATKQLALTRMDPNVVIRNARGIDQAAHDHPRTTQVISRLIVANHLAHRLPAEALDGRDQPREFRALASRYSECCVVRLSRFGNCRIAQFDSAAVHQAGLCRWTSEQHGTGPPGLDCESNGCPKSIDFLVHVLQAPVLPNN
jgi:hypothetical protein